MQLPKLKLWKNLFYICNTVHDSWCPKNKHLMLWSRKSLFTFEESTSLQPRLANWQGTGLNRQLFSCDCFMLRKSTSPHPRELRSRKFLHKSDSRITNVLYKQWIFILVSWLTQSTIKVLEKTLFISKSCHRGFISLYDFFEQNQIWYSWDLDIFYDFSSFYTCNSKVCVFDLV